MRNWNKRAAGVGAFALAALMAFAVPGTALAWDLNGESTEVNDIKTKEPSSLITSIQTNYHAQGITGFVVETPSTTVDSIMGITQEQKNNDGRGVIYIANTTCGELAQKAFDDAAAGVNGEILWLFDIQLFKYADNWYEPLTQISSPIRMAIGIGESERSSKYDYAMIRLHDGATTLLKDLDGDEWTLTFESDRFSTYAMIRYPKGTAPAPAQKPAENKTAGSAQAPGSQTGSSGAGSKPASSGELDDVPKTGDPTGLAAHGLMLTGSLFMAAGVFCLAVGRLQARRGRLHKSES